MSTTTTSVEHIEFDAQQTEAINALCGNVADIVEALKEARSAAKEGLGPILEGIMVSYWNKPVPKWDWKEDSTKPVPKARAAKINSAAYSALAMVARNDTQMQEEIYDACPACDSDEPLTALDIKQYVKACKGKLKGRVKTVRDTITQVLRGLGYWERAAKERAALTPEGIAKMINKLDDRIDADMLLQALPFLCEELGEATDWKARLVDNVPAEDVILAGCELADQLTPDQQVDVNAKSYELAAA